MSNIFFLIFQCYCKHDVSLKNDQLKVKPIGIRSRKDHESITFQKCIEI
jgi:hypothetical protein